MFSGRNVLLQLLSCTEHMLFLTHKICVSTGNWGKIPGERCPQAFPLCSLMKFLRSTTFALHLMGYRCYYSHLLISYSTQLSSLEVGTQTMKLKWKKMKGKLFFFSWDLQMLWQTALVRKHQKCNHINRIIFLCMWKCRWCIIYKWMKTQTLATTGLHNMVIKCFSYNESKKLLHSCNTTVERLVESFNRVLGSPFLKIPFILNAAWLHMVASMKARSNYSKVL